MGLDAIIRSGVKTAKTVTASLQVQVAHAAWTGQNAYGEPAYAAAVLRPAIVDWTQRLVRTSDGREVLSVLTLVFLEPVTLDIRDKLTLPDGRTAPLLAFKGVVDPATNQPYMTEAYCGAA
jgi:hypothetical protein